MTKVSGREQGVGAGRLFSFPTRCVRAFPSLHKQHRHCCLPQRSATAFPRGLWRGHTYPALGAQGFLVGRAARDGGRGGGDGSARGEGPLVPYLLVPDHRRPRDALHGALQSLLVLHLLRPSVLKQCAVRPWATGGRTTLSFVLFLFYTSSCKTACWSPLYTREGESPRKITGLPRTSCMSCTRGRESCGFIDRSNNC